MEHVFEFIFEIFFLRWIVRFLGVRTRYYFLSLIGKKVEIDALIGKKDDYPAQVGNDFLNAIVGLCVFSLLVVLLLFIFFGLF